MGNNLLSVWGTIGSVLLAILILLVMITVHEFGHYLAGKIFKFKINEFSIGFGPAIFKHRNKRTGELFAIRLIPLGGYCAFAGEDGLEKEKKKPEAPPEPFEEIPDRETDAEPRELPADAAEAPHELPADAGEAPQTLPAGAEDMPRAQKDPAGKKKKGEIRTGLFTEKKPWQRIIVLIAGALMNYFLAVMLIVVLFASYGQSMIQIGSVAESEEYPAQVSFQAGDILLAANGKNLYLTTDLSRAVNGKKEGDTVTFRVSRIREDGSRAVMDVPILLRSDVSTKNSSDFRPVWPALGIGITEDGKYYDIDTTSYHFGFFQTIGRSFVYSFKIAGTIFRVIGELFTGKIGLNSFGGPVTTITTTSQIVSTNGFRGFLEIAAFIGVNLAVFNLLPIPALDGSKVVFTIIEWIRGKPINRKVEAAIHLAGIILLFGFAILVDILQFV